MAQIFRPITNTLARVSLLGAVSGVVSLLWLTWAFQHSAYATRAGVVRDQPVPFSHKHHVGGIGIDCRYCHTSVEDSSFAGVPATEVCMTCHSQVWSESEMLAPVRESLRTGTPLRWARVNDLPDFVYFDHSVHVAARVGCSTCHGRVDLMPLTWAHATLLMRWCTDCHEAPARYQRDRPEEVFDMEWEPPEAEVEGSRDPQLLDCSVCHR